MGRPGIEPEPPAQQTGALPTALYLEWLIFGILRYIYELTRPPTGNTFRLNNQREIIKKFPNMKTKIKKTTSLKLLQAEIRPTRGIAILIISHEKLS